MRSPTNPFENLERLFEQMEENFEEAARWWESELPGTGDGTTAIRIDLKDADDEFVLTAELPGFERDEINVRVRDRMFQLEAEHDETSTQETDGEYLHHERHRASVARSLRLPEAIETDEITATYNNGVLTVRMPKSEPAEQGREIEIN